MSPRFVLPVRNEFQRRLPAEIVFKTQSRPLRKAVFQCGSFEFVLSEIYFPFFQVVRSAPHDGVCKSCRASLAQIFYQRNRLVDRRRLRKIERLKSVKPHFQRCRNRRLDGFRIQRQNVIVFQSKLKRTVKQLCDNSPVFFRAAFQRVVKLNPRKSFFSENGVETRVCGQKSFFHSNTHPSVLRPLQKLFISIFLPFCGCTSSRDKATPSPHLTNTAPSR